VLRQQRDADARRTKTRDQPPDFFFKQHGVQLA
jgi:hypothetical protein